VQRFIDDKKNTENLVVIKSYRVEYKEKKIHFMNGFFLYILNKNVA
jgi:hypothetical protein